ncbi:hypothetical protein BV25DRAFT_1863870, partial [Artomyces pyxidatus]
MASNISLNAGEVSLVNQIFAKNDPQKFGVITGDLAVSIFSGAKLPSATLGEIWSIADSENQGFLTRNGVAVAVRLIGWAQKGDKVSEALVEKPGPIAVIEGYSGPTPTRSAVSPTPKSPAPPLPPPLTPQDKAKFSRLFNSCGPVNGLLNGDRARDVFVKSKLPMEKLSQIWNLSDTQNRGSLDVTDFTIAMYLIQASMSGALSFVPTTLPPGLYEQASGTDSISAFSTSSVKTHATGGSGSFSPGLSGVFPSRPGGSAVQPQYTGQALQQQFTGQPVQQHFTGQALQHQYTGQPLQPQSTGAGITPAARQRTAPAVPPFPLPQNATGQAPAWDVTPAEKTSADNFFTTLDSRKQGYIEGDIAVPFLLQSKLPEDVLAQVWDLADLNNDGRLTRDGFAVALHLIQGKLAGKEVPATLPPSLVPPSMRTNGAASPFQTQIPKASEPLRDLLWDDSPPASATVPPSQSSSTLQPQQTGSILQSQQTGSILQPQQTGPKLQSQQTGSIFQPQQPQYTGSVFTNSPSFPVQPPPASRPQTQDPFGSAPSHRDLLGDDEDTGAASPPIHDHSAEIGNVQIQLHSTNRSLDTTKSEVSNVEASVDNQAAQLSALQTQLSSAKAAYETETRLLSALRERFSKQTSEIQKAREELIRAESDLSAVRVEKGEVEQHVLRDKEEVRDLQRKMTETGTTIEQFKAEIEKAKKDAKQQKGLLAIAKKQLAAREAERAKVEKELQEAQAEAEEATKEREAVEAELSTELPSALTNGGQTALSADSLSLAVAHPLPVSPGSPSSLVSQTPTPAKSTNPFERINSGSSVRSQSPFLPFSNASVPTPTGGIIAPPDTTTGEVTTDDPFSFDQAFGGEDDHKVAVDNTGTSVDLGGDEQPATPRPLPAGVIIPHHDDISSPTSDHDLFSTPPMTAATISPDGETHSLTPALGVQAAAAQFPPLDAPSAAPVDESHHATDLSAQLQELDVDESDSDSEDEAPLATLVHKAAPTAEPSKEGAAPALNGHGTPPGLEAHASNLSAQATSSPAPAQFPPVLSPPVLPPTSNGSTPFGETPFDPFPAAPAAEPAKVAGVSDFDEALGKIPSSGGGPAADSGFSFDSAFEDNFDFAAASGPSAFPPAPSANGTTNSSMTLSKSTLSRSVDFDSVFAPQTTTTPASPPSLPAAVTVPPNLSLPQESKPFSFDDAFNGSAVPAPPVKQPSGSSASHGISFDDAFGGAPSQTLALDSGFGSTSSRGSAIPQTQSPVSTTFPASSPLRAPTSPRTASRLSTSPPPPRDVTPPPRV